MPVIEDVEVKQSQIEGAGKGFFARKTFSPGDVVFSVDRPLVAELENDRMLDTCAWCCQRAATDPMERAQMASMGLPQGFTEIKSCTACQRVGYCSKTCQSKAWKREHKYECKIIGVKDRPDLPPQIRAVIKCLGRLKADTKSELTTVHNILNLRPSGDPNSLEDFRKQDKKRFDDFQFLGHGAWHYSGEPKIEGVDAQAVSRGLLFNIMSNTFTLSSPLDDVNLGNGFDPLICTANHSCDPNALLVFNQPRTEIRALKPLKAGEEILLKYIEVTNPFSVRQADLKETYLFTCQCSKCKKGANQREDQFLGPPEKLESAYYGMADKLVSQYESILSKYYVPGGDLKAQKRLAAMQAEAYTVLENGQASLEDVKRTLQMCIDSKMWRWTRQPVPQLCRRLFSLYLESGSFYKAFRLGVKLHLEILPELYPQAFYPDRLTNAWAVSTLINVLCGSTHEELYQELAQGGLELRLIYFGFLFYVYEHTPQMYGFSSPFGKVVENTYKQIMAGVGIPEADIKEKVQASWHSLEMVARNVSVSSL
ncbi:SET domain-containing protein [Xylariaceae sp. FL1651]|nr:SET domain-containing protein [Xylariaceae sp. FL1651]